MEPITKQEAEQFNDQEFLDNNHKQAVEEALEKINTSIKIHYKKIDEGKLIYTAPMMLCTQYQKLTAEIMARYNEQGWFVQLVPGSTCFSISKIVDMTMGSTAAQPAQSTIDTESTIIK